MIRQNYVQQIFFILNFNYLNNIQICELQELYNIRYLVGTQYGLKPSFKFKSFLLGRTGQLVKIRKAFLDKFCFFVSFSLRINMLLKTIQ